MVIPQLIIAIIQVVLISAISPLFIGIIRTLKARMQNRVGASVWQPYRNLWKLWHKDETISHDASWIFLMAPYIIFSTTLLLAAAIPVISVIAAVPVLSDLLVIIYIVALGVFWLALAGLDVGGAFGGLGSSREMTLAALTEGTVLFSLFAVAARAGTTNVTLMMATVTNELPLLLAPLLVAFVAYVIALLAENARYPFDNPATHLELTMVHEAMILEYSGKRLALLEWAAANKLLCFMVLGVNLFFPWGILVTATVPGILVMVLLVGFKVLLLAANVAVLESAIAKLRFFRLPDLLFTSLVLAIIALALSMLTL